MPVCRDFVVSSANAIDGHKRTRAYDRATVLNAASERSSPTVEAAADEDDPRAAIVVRPGVQVLRRVDGVLHAVHEQRPLGADVEQSLDAEHVLATRLKEHRQPDAECGPVELLVEEEADGVDRRPRARDPTARRRAGRGPDARTAGRARRRRRTPRSTSAVGFSARAGRPSAPSRRGRPSSRRACRRSPTCFSDSSWRRPLTASTVATTVSSA